MGEITDRIGNPILVKEGKLICSACNVREGHEHRCFRNIKLPDRLVTVRFVYNENDATEQNFPVLLFEGYASDLNPNLLVLKCDYECQKRPTEASLVKWAEAGHPNNFEFEFSEN